MIRKLLTFTCLALSVGANAAALPFTYDFGFIGSEDGFSGTGSFTVSTSENLSTGIDGLETFEFTGLCAGYDCSFDLADVTTTGYANWSVNETTGEISQLFIGAYGYLSEASAESRLYLGTGDIHEIYLGCWAKSDSSSESCNGDWFDYRAETYPGIETYVTLRPDAPVVPIPAAAWLFGSALVGLGVVKRKKG